MHSLWGYSSSIAFSHEKCFVKAKSLRKCMLYVMFCLIMGTIIYTFSFFNWIVLIWFNFRGRDALIHTTSSHSERWSYVNFTWWTVVPKKTNVFICTKTSHANIITLVWNASQLISASLAMTHFLMLLALFYSRLVKEKFITLRFEIYML